MKFRPTFAHCLALSVAFTALPATAQDYGRAPGGYVDPMAGDDDPMAAPRGRTDSPDTGNLAIRMSKAENRIREMTGQIEELQNTNRRLVEQVQKFQADVDSRLSAAPPRKRSEAERAPEPEAASAQAEPSTPKPRKRRDEAFDPDTAGADVPGKPKPLGSAASAQPDDSGGKPMDLAGGRLGRGGGGNDDTLAPTLRLPSSTPRQVGGTVTPGGTIIANADAAGGAGVAPSTPRGEFDAALGLYRDKQYEEAQKGFTTFIQKNPKSKLAADATYYLGESYEQRGRTVEAAEQYVKFAKEYASSSRAPDGMLHLGISMRMLGHSEQACATLTALTQKYPNAPAYVKSGAERESKRSQCQG